MKPLGHQHRSTAFAKAVFVAGVLCLVMYSGKYWPESKMLVAVIFTVRLSLCALVGVALSSLIWMLLRLTGSQQRPVKNGLLCFTGLALIATSLIGVGSTVPGELLDSWR